MENEGLFLTNYPDIKFENEKQIIEQKINNSKNDKSYNDFVDEILSYKNVDLSLARVIFKRIDVSLDEKQNKVLTFVYNI